jgi:asparagine synthase (glutamine-hydrolysing)
MCRITGVISPSTNESTLVKMLDTLVHGGPDDSGIFINTNRSIGLGQRRLAIIDLSQGGHQPKKWNEFVVVFNGEIYNYQEISDELSQHGYTFDSTSDTEVLLKAFEKWGTACVHKFRGMFSFAIWNEKTNRLLLCRDRLGVKPLYWYQKDNLFMFASELKAFHQHPNFDMSINQEAVSLYLQTGYIKSPHCIFKYAHKLEPGHFLEVEMGQIPQIWSYWKARNFLNQKTAVLSDTEAISECENVLTESFKLRMVADVQVGMFLSGGIDSSLVTALLQNCSTKPLNTFTIGFDDLRFNEASFAKEIAKHLKTNHTELYCKESDFDEIIQELPDIYDEPFGDSSGIPTFLVSKLARQKVKVSLSADGGDELFTGYNRYLFAENLFSKFDKIPNFLKSILSNTVSKIDVKSAEAFLNILPVPAYYKKNVDARLPKLQATLKAKSHLEFLYSSTIFVNTEQLERIHKSDKIATVFDRHIPEHKGFRFASYGVADIESYLEGDILCKVDRATMRVALEGREPFLDHKIVEYALGLSDKFKIRDNQTKWLLRQILYKYVPKELIERPKMGFGIPLDRWLSTILVGDLELMKNDTYFFEAFNLNKTEVGKLVDLYLAGKSFSPFFIWYLYCLYKWYLRWIEK